MSSRNMDRCYFPLLYLKHVFTTITKQTEENSSFARQAAPSEAPWSCSPVSVTSEDELFGDLEW